MKIILIKVQDFNRNKMTKGTKIKYECSIKAYGQFLSSSAEFVSVNTLSILYNFNKII